VVRATLYIICSSTVPFLPPFLPPSLPSSRVLFQAGMRRAPPAPPLIEDDNAINGWVEVTAEVGGCATACGRAGTREGPREGGNEGGRGSASK